MADCELCVNAGGVKGKMKEKKNEISVNYSPISFWKLTSLHGHLLHSQHHLNMTISFVAGKRCALHSDHEDQYQQKVTVDII